MSHLAFFAHANVIHNGGQPVPIELSIASIPEDGKDPEILVVLSVNVFNQNLQVQKLGDRVDSVPPSGQLIHQDWQKTEGEERINLAMAGFGLGVDENRQSFKKKK
ncbi:hypothetical protein TNCV_2414651 [Trichonephila clavipes]|nr:hypothetical protein TNCV_2414651 [Trichonephila clavipes]